MKSSNFEFRVSNRQSEIANRKLRGVATGGWGLVLAAGLACFMWASSFAFPPAPYHTLFGLVRNQWGDPIQVAGAEVFLENTNGTAVMVSLIPHLDPGVNYELHVPMDAGIAPDLYQPAALKTSFPFRLRVKIGPTVYLPIEMAGNLARIGQPAQSTRLDLTLGEDTDGDGLPDAWERALIAALGGNLSLADIRPNDDSDNDGISNLNEYYSGTYPFDPGDGFSLALLGIDQGTSMLEFLAIRGRTYSLETSPDLQQWTPVQFRVAAEGPGAALRSNYSATDVRLLRVEVPFQNATNRYFRARLQ